MSAFKKLRSADSFTSVHNAHKSFTVPSASFESNGITVSNALENTSYLYPSDAEYNSSLNYRSIKHLYYDNFNVSSSILISGSYEHYLESSFISGSRILPTTSSILSVPKSKIGSYFKPGSVVLNMISTTVFEFQNPGKDASDPDDAIGDYPESGLSLFGTERILRNNSVLYSNSLLSSTFTGNNIYYSDGFSVVRIASNGTTSEADGSLTSTNAIAAVSESFELTDDKNGNLSGSNIPSNLTGSIGNEKFLGNVFYKHGLITLTDQTIIDNFESSSLSWESTYPVFTQNTYCKIKSSEFNFTQNPTACQTEAVLSGSLSYSGGLPKNNITGSEFAPYITTVGLYNDAHELIAVAKLGQPIPKSKTNDMTFVVKFDI